MLSVFPVRVREVDRRVAGWAMVLAPGVGVGLGVFGGGLVWGGGVVFGEGVLAGVVGVAGLAWATRGLHLDGLADLADGLGSGKEAGGALAVMKRSDIGPFGVVAVVLNLLLQVGAVAQMGAQVGAVVLGVACVAGRLAVTWGCREGVPSAREEGLGALVAGTVGWVRAVTATAITVALTFLAMSRDGWIYLVSAVGLGLLVAWGVRRRAVRRLGGVTGDVLGSLVEVTTTTVLVTAAALLT
ncbi:adenosylcobinamide-GDP ribazoletransferase [Acrocarpospora corrugata]|uniref:adenosylcobinamide-GDP ribazoletransferase n=2 Tax=Acrocarpospora corrugata TaxID=35763 RepID=UPI0031D2B4CD